MMVLVLLVCGVVLEEGVAGPFITSEVLNEMT